MKCNESRALLWLVGIQSVSAALFLRRPSEADINPLLEVTELPRFAHIDVLKHARSAVLSQLSDGRTQAKQLEANLRAKLAGNDTISYADVATPLEQLSEDVGRPWGLLQHLQSVRQAPQLRDTIAELEPEVVTFNQELSQSRPIFDAVLQLSRSAGFQKLSEAQRRVVLNEVRDRRLSGVGLSDKASSEFNQVSQSLTKLSNEFSNHVLDATAAWNLTLHDKEKLRGVPPRALELAAANARRGGFPNATGELGPWVLKLDAPLYGPVMTYAEDRSLREQLFWAGAKRASFGKTSNEPTIAKILENRHRAAELLGYGSYADVSFASKMASKQEVHKLMERLQGAAKEAAIQDLKDVNDFAKRVDKLDKVKHWDRGFYIERLKKEKFAYDSEMLREYFPIDAVLLGLFGLSHRLFGTDVNEVASAEAKDFLWDQSVRLFEVRRNGSLAGRFFLDAYSRPGQKRAGAWVQPMLSRKSSGGKITQHPLAAIVCNFPQPQGEKPALLAFGEVETLFHEFGHMLQHVLTVQDETAVAGLNGVEWDAVEIASQFMEYWVTDDRATLYSFAKHYKTHSPLPEATYKSVKASMNFRAASTILGQVYLGSIDLRLHERFQEGEDVFAINEALARSILPEPPLHEDRFLCSFQHIFSGGYAAGYYSYQWSKVLSADAFSAFAEGGGLSDEKNIKATGRRFAGTVLALGGGRPPAAVFQDFRGRQPSIAALLRYNGLRAASAEAAGLL
mmetsp:Transcript_33972/g.62011  ORF Transcript_33972/g.62011 Transcript_33972/m.62011 type:complete len:737 (+) Transcript_33972:41-2251(+)